MTPGERLTPQPKRGYWYLVTVIACPVCGREKVYRERQYTPRPESSFDRHEYHEHYDWCDAL